MKSQRPGSFLVLVVLHQQAQTCSEAALMRSISLHSLSLGTSMFPLGQLGSKPIGSPSGKQPGLGGHRSLLLLSPAASFTPYHEKPRSHVMATKKTLICWPRSSVNGNRCKEAEEILFILHVICPGEGSFCLNMKLANCRQLEQIHHSIICSWNPFTEIWAPVCFDPHISLVDCFLVVVVVEIQKLSSSVSADEQRQILER